MLLVSSTLCLIYLSISIKHTYIYIYYKYTLNSYYIEDTVLIVWGRIYTSQKGNRLHICFSYLCKSGQAKVQVQAEISLVSIQNMPLVVGTISIQADPSFNSQITYNWILTDIGPILIQLSSLWQGCVIDIWRGWL